MDNRSEIFSGMLPRPTMDDGFIAGNSGFVIAEKMYEQYPLIDITNSFPANSSQKFFDILQYFHTVQGISRFPVVGVLQTGEPPRVYMLTHEGEYNKMNHATLIKILKIKDSQIAFTTSLEGYSSKRDSRKCLELALKKKSFYVPLQRGSDIYQPGFTPNAQNTLKTIFEKIPGVTFLD